MSNGDAKAAIRIAKQSGMGPFWISLYRDQLWYRLPRLLSTATECRDAYERRGKPMARQDAADCNRFILDVANQLGDARAYFDALAWRRRHTAARQQRSHPGAGFRLLYPKLDVAGLAASIPAYSTEVGSTAPMVLRYRTPASHSSEFAVPEDGETSMHEPVVPVITMTINGHRVDASVDSGQEQALVMSATESRVLGLRRLAPGSRGFQLVGKPIVPAGSVSLSLVRQLKLGTLQENNVMAIVIPDSYGIDGKRELVVGLPLLARFNNVVFNKSRMVLNAPAASCPHPLPATYATGPGRGGLLVFDADMDGRPIKVSVDTGSNILLVAGKELLPSDGTTGTPADAGRAHGERMFRYLAIRVAGLALSNDITPVLPKLVFPAALIGAPALATLDIRFNFMPKLSFCLTRRLSPKADIPRPQRKTGMHLTGLVSEVHLLHMPPGTNGTGTRTKRMPSFEPVSAFRTPLLQGMNMYPGRAIADRYVPPPPPWLHFHFHCAIYHGNVYIDGSVTGNFGRPVPDATVYIGHGSSAVMALTSSDSGHFDGVAALPAGPIATPANMTRTPIQCTLPRVKVGAPSRAK
ncbi:MAG TPA: aspartyl protease family protein [Rhodanobacteraceae bacterium]|nr:aspartyl protease family protein [Rhodanobacteraceae bacterium]